MFEHEAPHPGVVGGCGEDVEIAIDRVAQEGPQAIARLGFEGHSVVIGGGLTPGDRLTHPRMEVHQCTGELRGTRGGIAVHAEMRPDGPLRAHITYAIEGLQPGPDIDARGRSGRMNRGPVVEQNTQGVARDQRAVGFVEKGDVVGGVTGSLEDPQPPRWTPVSPTPRPDPVARHRPHLAPEAVVGVAEGAPGTGNQPLGVGQVGRPIDVHMHLQARIGSSQMAGRPRMVEVHMGQAEMPHLTERDPLGRRALLQPGQPRRGSRIDENELVADQEGRADRPVEPVEADVDDAEALAQRSSTGTKVRSRRPV